MCWFSGCGPKTDPPAKGPADGAVESNNNASESNAPADLSSSSSASTKDRQPQQASLDTVADIPRAFDTALRLGDHETAEAVVKQGIQKNPDDATLRRLLAQLLNAQGRRHEATEHVIHLIRLRAILPHELLSLIDRSGPFLLVTYDSIDFVGNDTLFGLGQARILYFAKRTDPDEILSLLNQVKEKHGDQPAVVAFTGRVLAETGRWEEFETWLQGLPTEANRLLEMQTQPEYWHALGTWLSHRGRHEEAIRTWGEALRRDPTSRASLRSMIVTMENHVEHEDVGKLRTWLADLDRVFRIAKDADAQQAAWIAERFQSWIRPWEAAGWTVMAAQMSGQLQTIAPQLDQSRDELLRWEANATDQKIQDARLTASLGFSIEDFPLPDVHSREPLIESNRLAQSDEPSPNKPNFSLNDVAASVGLRTRFSNDFPVEKDDFFLYQTNGGGFAVLDYDLDGRCDLYFAQAGGSPTEPQSSRANQLFRLLPNQTFEETTVQSSTGDRGYGQGICVGDVNQDGFPDILVANIGSNSFYVNQGDGTFVQANKRLQPLWASDDTLQNWTSSLGLADLDSDGLPELIEVNYINDPTAFQTRCTDPYDNCQPQGFSPCPDRVYRMQPDGTLKLWSSVTQAMSEVPKFGFGLVIANFDQRCGNDFFISNDGDLNHLWNSQCPSSASQDTGSLRKQPLAAEIQMAETAGLAGCAVGRNGDAQACMGVASGDFNRDGKLDLHVTNFYKEPVNLFIQTAPGFFSDESLSYRLYKPSFDVLGFGTQSADFDNDGWPDIAVLNGYLHDSSARNIPYKMLPQLFTGSAAGFQLLEAELLGKYWEQPQLGRTLAMLDWNRDGRMDLLANSLDSDIALLQNDSLSTSSNWIQFELVGLNCERDAIGAVVEVEAHDANNKQTLFGWQVGGDGYMCTNEQVIHIGLGELGDIDQVRIRWPSGNVQSLDQGVPRHRYLVVENQAIFSR